MNASPLSHRAAASGRDTDGIPRGRGDIPPPGPRRPAEPEAKGMPRFTPAAQAGVPLRLGRTLAALHEAVRIWAA
ncbi:hypothetical protein GCM10022214_03640 [Actinomadura miaoliensis]|uniref:Uncharacterized protein n=1 Tax=Actinomadura miaoliensis TaxID=430685 RepID=A0ABP7UZM2_9ACTN